MGHRDVLLWSGNRGHRLWQDAEYTSSCLQNNSAMHAHSLLNILEA
eukprot:COSAG02_NODE_235_length_27784_cov_9.895828_16_plen_46_part_00